MFPTVSGGSASKGYSFSLTPDSPSKTGNVIVDQTRQQHQKTCDLKSWLEAWLAFLINQAMLVAYQLIKFPCYNNGLSMMKGFSTLFSTKPMTPRQEDL